MQYKLSFACGLDYSLGMSKAFKKDNDNDEQEEPEIPASNVTNYVTPAGLAALQNELRHLMQKERPKVVEAVHWAAKNGDRSENGDYIYGKRRMREIDRRVRYLTKRLDHAKVVDPKLQTNLAKVFFGATVTYADADGKEITVKIVGIDEADLNVGKISWTSPVAKALLKAEVGDTVKLRTPEKETVLEVLAIKYEI